MSALTSRWTHFEHRADMGVEGLGATPAEAFEQAALALTAIVCDLEAIRPSERVTFSCKEPNLELLLVDWLNALVYEMATRRMLFVRFGVHLTESGLEAEAWGEPVDSARHHPVVEVKGATYTALTVQQLPDGGWLARCVVDV
ncbi:MAG: archease [Anaerolineae bacterium]